MTLGGRIKKVRKEVDLTQRDFGAQIGTTQNAIASYEIGRREPSAAAINNICKTFNVDEHWLRTGEGDMLVKRSETDELATAVERLITGESADFKRRFISALSTLKDEHWLLLESKLKEIVGARDNAERLESISPSDIDAEAESYRAELKLQAEVEEESSASDGPNGIGEEKMA